MNLDEILKIANCGGCFDEIGGGSWLKTKIRKGDKIGIIIRDENGAFRILTVQFDDCIEKIMLNNIGLDPEYVHEYEWFTNNKWYKF